MAPLGLDDPHQASFTLIVSFAASLIPFTFNGSSILHMMVRLITQISDILLVTLVDMKRYYDSALPQVSSQAPNHTALCSALIENNALQLISDQNSQWKLHAPKQVFTIHMHTYTYICIHISMHTLLSMYAYLFIY